MGPLDPCPPSTESQLYIQGSLAQWIQWLTEHPEVGLPLHTAWETKRAVHLIWSLKTALCYANCNENVQRRIVAGCSNQFPPDFSDQFDHYYLILINYKKNPATVSRSRENSSNIIVLTTINNAVCFLGMRAKQKARPCRGTIQRERFRRLSRTPDAESVVLLVVRRLEPVAHRPHARALKHCEDWVVCNIFSLEKHKKSNPDSRNRLHIKQF